MLFTTDRQTLDDLNIFGRHGGDSVYAIFNRCATRGGAAILEEMFRYPLSEEEAINRRCAIIQSFATAGTRFTFTIMHFDAVETFLANNDERTRLSAENASLGKKLSNIVAMDAETVQIHKGIQATVALLQECDSFLSALFLPPDHAYLPEKKAMEAILQEPFFAPVLESKGKISQATLAAFDSLFRFRHRQQVEKLLRSLYLLDMYLAVARVAIERAFCFPKALPRHEQVLKLAGVYHLQVKNAVSNTLHITPGNNVLFLTGANMAGKSTFMKSVSIALFLAHMGLPVPATSMEFSVMDGIYTTINLPDNLGMGASHFYAEVLRVKKMAQELSTGKKLFIVFDELFRGTNVKDAYEATIAVTKGFALERNSIFIISTHIIEAGDVLREQCDNVYFIYLPTRMNGNMPVYTYQLEQGITADRHGMVIIHNEGILDILEEGKKNYVTHS